MSTSTTPNGGPESEREDALEAAREHRERFERIAGTDLPFAPYARRVLDRLDREGSDE